jgi:hypothetical protein
MPSLASASVVAVVRSERGGEECFGLIAKEWYCMQGAAAAAVAGAA